MHDLDLIAVRQGAAAVRIARHDSPVALDRDATLIEPQRADEIRDGGPVGQRPALSVDDHVHVENIVISGYLYNLKTIW